jgi:hypothetical protein
MKYSTRLVFLFNNIVIKIPLSKRGYLQGLNERVIWNKYKEYAPLAELKWMYLGIVCQKKYKTIKEIPENQVKYIKSIITEFDFDNCDLYNYENWGIDNDKYILLDYGVNQEIAKLY